MGALRPRFSLYVFCPPLSAKFFLARISSVEVMPRFCAPKVKPRFSFNLLGDGSDATMQNRVIHPPSREWAKAIFSATIAYGRRLQNARGPLRNFFYGRNPTAFPLNTLFKRAKSDLGKMNLQV
jgi:hypothetical protein